MVRLVCMPVVNWVRSATRAPKTAMATAPPTWRKVLNTALAVPALSGATLASTSPVVGGMASDPPGADRDDQQRGEQRRPQRRGEHHPGQSDHHRGQPGHDRDPGAEPVGDRAADQVPDHREQRRGQERKPSEQRRQPEVLLQVQAAEEHRAVPADHEREPDHQGDPHAGRAEQLQRHHRMRHPALDEQRRPTRLATATTRVVITSGDAEAVRAALDQPVRQPGQRDHPEDLPSPVERRRPGRRRRHPGQQDEHRRADRDVHPEHPPPVEGGQQSRRAADRARRRPPRRRPTPRALGPGAPGRGTPPGSAPSTPAASPPPPHPGRPGPRSARRWSGPARRRSRSDRTAPPRCRRPASRRSDRPGSRRTATARRTARCSRRSPTAARRCHRRARGSIWVSATLTIRMSSVIRKKPAEASSKAIRAFAGSRSRATVRCCGQGQTRSRFLGLPWWAHLECNRIPGPGGSPC